MKVPIVNNLDIIHIRMYSDTGILLAQEVDTYLFHLWEYKHFF